MRESRPHLALETVPETRVSSCAMEAVCEAGDGTHPFRQDWLSPRISFSQDFAMTDNSTHSNNSSRLSPEKRKWEQTSEDEYSAEFEFRMASNSDSRSHGSQKASGEMMLSADELFIDGKLRPLHFPRDRPLASDDLHLPWQSSGHKLLLQKAHRYPMARHLSLESSRCSSLSFDASHDPSNRRACLSLENSRSSSPSRNPLPITSPVSPKASSKYSSKIKKFFKPKKVPLQPSTAQLSRDNSVTSSCRLPISPRSFWPFSRSNSAGESKTTLAVPALPRRSNSAGESKTTSARVISKKADAVDVTKTCAPSSDSAMGSSKFQGKTSHSIPPSESEQKKGGVVRSTYNPSASAAGGSEFASSSAMARLSTPSPAFNAASVHKNESYSTESVPSIEGSSSLRVAASLKQPDQSITPVDPYRDVRKREGVNVSRVRRSGSPGRVLRRRVSSPAGNFARGSPGRRGFWSGPGGKGNTGKIVLLRNLERCSAGAKVGMSRSGDAKSIDSRDGWKGPEKRNAYPVAVRVFPVLNVAVYRGKTSRTRLFSFGNLFSSRKEKPMEAPINNWRSGA